jgi:hypothetical protein
MPKVIAYSVQDPTSALAPATNLGEADDMQPDEGRKAEGDKGDGDATNVSPDDKAPTAAGSKEDGSGPMDIDTEAGATLQPATVCVSDASVLSTCATMASMVLAPKACLHKSTVGAVILA